MSRQVKTYSEWKFLIKHGPRVTIDEPVHHVSRENHLQRSGAGPGAKRRTRGSVTFIYVELIPEVMTEQRLMNSSFSPNDQEIICIELRGFIERLRQSKQEDADNFIGSITRSPLRDRCFRDLPPAGPFRDSQEFYDWMEWLVQRYLEPSQRYHDSRLALMPKNSLIVFAHADIHPAKIVVSNAGPPQLLALIDWGRSKWYPDYWEFSRKNDLPRSLAWNARGNG